MGLGSSCPRGYARLWVILAECLELTTATSPGYLAVSVAGTSPCTALGATAIPVMDPADVLTLPFWSCLAGGPRQIDDDI